MTRERKFGRLWLMRSDDHRLYIGWWTLRWGHLSLVVGRQR